jgi:tRNA (adenine37-N6)-methyltransferase
MIVQERIETLEKEVEKQIKLRAEERNGRTKLQMELRNLRISQAEESGYHFKPIGHVRTTFPGRAGTPRQPGLVTSSKALLSVWCADALKGLSLYSHCYLVFVFHANTDMGSAKVGGTIKPLVKPPRLAGESTGVFSCRTPHRPNPIGLSLCKIERVEGKNLHLSGVDLVDGTPILDIKPYLPYSDKPGEDAAVRYPDWLDSDYNNIHSVALDESLVPETWPKSSLLCNRTEICLFIIQVLSFDVRSLIQKERHMSEYSVLLDVFKVYFTIEGSSVTVHRIECANVANE